MRASSISTVARSVRASIAPRTAVIRFRRSPLEAALTRFASELSPATGQPFFDRLVEFVADVLGFEAVVVGEFTRGPEPRFTPLAEFPAGFEATPGRAVVEAPLVAATGVRIGLIRAFEPEERLDPSTTDLFLHIVAQRAAAELERQHAQRDLERRDALFVGLSTEAHDVVGVIDDAGAFTAVSAAMERVLGYAAADCVGLPVSELVHPLDRPAIDAMLRIAGQHGYSVEARLQKRDGGWLTMAVTLAQHEDACGRCFKVFSAHDLTDQRRLEDRLRQSQKTEIVGRLASGIVHDFGNLLMVVGTHADIMRLRTEPDDERTADVDAIQAAVTRGADLARQLLAFTRHREFEIRRIDINASIEQLATLLRRLVGPNIKLATYLSPDARYIDADVAQIEQVILNLTLNARDAMPNGGTITFATTRAVKVPVAPPSFALPEDYLCLSVTDTGCGIRDEVKPHVFEPLFTTKEGTGTGNGLAIVHDIVSRHGGTVEVLSEEGRGATFKVYLPRYKAPARKAAPRGERRRDAALEEKVRAAATADIVDRAVRG